MNRILQQLSLLVQQGKIDPPGIDSQTVDRPLGFGLDQALLDLMKQTEYIPVLCAANSNGSLGNR